MDAGGGKALQSFTQTESPPNENPHMRPLAKAKPGSVARSMRIRSAAAFLLAACAAAGRSDASGQTTVRIADRRPTCEECVIRLNGRMELQAVDSLPITGEPRQVVAFAHRYLLVDQQERSVAYLFDDRGRFIRAVGRKGMGPGEFLNIRAVAVHADTALVLDERLAKESAVVASGGVVRERSVELHNIESALMVGDRMIINANVPTARRAGIPIHSLGDNGRLDRSFDAGNASLLPENPWILPRVLAPSVEGTFWAIARDAYVAERWTQEGRLLSTVEREAEWYPAHSVRPIGTAETPPPWTTGIREIGRDTIMVLILVASPGYSALLGPRRMTPRGLRYDVSDRGALYDTVVEVLDLGERRVVARTVLDEYLLGFADDRTVYGYETADDGSPHVFVANLTLATSK